MLTRSHKQSMLKAQSTIPQLQRSQKNYENPLDNTSPSFQKEEIDALHQQGFAVFRSAFHLDNGIHEKIRDSRFVPIFNGLDGNKVTYDGKRLMATGIWSTSFKEKLSLFLKRNTLLDCADGQKNVTDVYALRSLPGCPMQPKHADSAHEESLRDKHPSNVPLAVLYAIDADTRLKIWPFGASRPTVLVLQPTDLVVFRGDTAHAGYKYDTENTRLHAYIDSTAPGCRRVKDKTYIVVESHD